MKLSRVGSFLITSTILNPLNYEGIKKKRYNQFIGAVSYNPNPDPDTLTQTNTIENTSVWKRTPTPKHETVLLATTDCYYTSHRSERGYMHMGTMGEKHRVAHCNNNRRQLQHSGNNSMEPALGEQSRSELVNAQSPMTDRPAELRMKIVVRLR